MLKGKSVMLKTVELEGGNREQVSFEGDGDALELDGIAGATCCERV